MSSDSSHYRPDARRSVLRSAGVWTPIFVLSAALSVLFAIIAIEDSPGAWVSFAITALIALLSGVSAFGALRDLYAEPIETTGPIERKWRKSDVIFFRGHYLLMYKRVFRVPREIYDAMPDVGGHIVIEHYPHTNALVSWRRAPGGAAVEEADHEPADEFAPAPGSSERRERDAPARPPAPSRRVEPPTFDDLPPPPSDFDQPRGAVQPPSFGRSERDADETSRR